MPERAAVGMNAYEVCLHHNCNLRCAYCSTGYGRWGAAPVTMTDAQLAAAVDFMVRNGDERFRVVLSGGEPLMAMDLLRRLVAQLRAAVGRTGQRTLMEVATNGTLLDREVAEFLVANRIQVSFSLDGTETDTNQYRRFAGRGNVYHNAIAGLDTYRRCLEAAGAGDIRLRADCTIDDPDRVSSSVDHLFDLGFHQVLVRPMGPSLFTGFTPDVDMERFIRSFSDLSRRLLQEGDPMALLDGRSHRVLLNIIEPLQHWLVQMPMPRSCQVLHRQVCIRADGRLVPCFAFNGPDEAMFFVGDVQRGLDSAAVASLWEQFRRWQPDCDECEVRMMCDKGCFRQFFDAHRQGIAKDQYPFCRDKRRMIGALTRVAEEIYG